LKHRFQKNRFCGNSGLQLPKISLGLWHNFGDVDDFDVATDLICQAFEMGITHFDLANNYGSPAGSVSTTLQKQGDSRLPKCRCRGCCQNRR